MFGSKESKEQLRTFVVRIVKQLEPEYVVAHSVRLSGDGAVYAFRKGEQCVAMMPKSRVELITSHIYARERD